MALNKPVRRIAIVGTGVIGASWAAEFLAHGFDVVATDPAPNAEENLRRCVDPPCLRRPTARKRWYDDIFTVLCSVTETSSFGSFGSVFWSALSVYPIAAALNKLRLPVRISFEYR